MTAEERSAMNAELESLADRASDAERRAAEAEREAKEERQIADALGRSARMAVEEMTVAVQRQKAAESRVEALTAQKDGAYRERDQVVALAARMACALHWPAWLGRHEDKPGDPPWEDDWRNIVFLELPSGQVSWHIHDSEAHLFDFLPRRNEPWDGHNTAEKYRRCEAPWPWRRAALRDEQVLASAQRALVDRGHNAPEDFGAAPAPEPTP